MSNKKKTSSALVSNVAALLARINVIKTQGEALYSDVHALAVDCLKEASIGHNYTPATELVKAVMAFKGSRPKALVVWFRTFGPMQWTEKTNSFKRNPEKTDYEIEQGAKTPYWELNPEKEIQELTLEGFQKLVEGMIKRAKGERKGETIPQADQQGILELAARLERDIVPAIAEAIKARPVVEAEVVDVVAEDETIEAQAAA